MPVSVHTLPQPARLTGIVARAAPKAVILRRGPSNWMRLILWHTDSDTFEYGQWLRGRIYGERCALSPDGSLFVYFAAQHHKFSKGYLGTWTAISRPPYFTALALWPLGNTWSGGGLFLDNRTVCLSNCGQLEPHPDHVPPKKLRVITSADQLTKRDHETMQRIRAQDWQLIQQTSNPHGMYGRRVDDPTIHHRAHPTNERYTLIQRYFGYIPGTYTGPTILEYALNDHVNNTETFIEGANWADWDQQGRLIYARDGQVFAQTPQQIGTFARPLADFNDQTFEEVPPPFWATRWP